MVAEEYGRLNFSTSVFEPTGSALEINDSTIAFNISILSYSGFTIFPATAHAAAVLGLAR